MCAQKINGFTLIELLVSLVIGIIFIALVVPAYQLYIANSRSSALANQFILSVQLARSNAITRATAVSLCAVDEETEDTCADPDDDNDWADGWFIFTDGGVAGSVDGTDEILHRHYSTPLNSTLMGPGRLVTFNAEGYLDNDADGEYFANYIECYGGGRGKLVTLNTSGKPRVSSAPCDTDEEADDE